MRYLLPTGLASVLVLGSALAFAQAVPGPGIHAIALPKGSSGAKQVQSTTLLETPHLKLVSIVIPKGGLLPAHSAQGQATVQTLSGSGELRMGARTEHLDTSHIVVLAPGAEHEVRAGAESDLVLLVHQVASTPKQTGRGMMMGGHGQRMGPGARMGTTPPQEAPPATKK